MSEDLIDELVLRAVNVRASLRPAPDGFAWRGVVSDDHRPASWGYSDEQATVRITWTLERDAAEPTPPDFGTSD